MCVSQNQQSIDSFYCLIRSTFIKNGVITTVVLFSFYGKHG